MAVIALVAVLVGVALMILAVPTVAAVRSRRREQLWWRAWVLAVEHPELVAQVGEQMGFTPVDAVSIDALPHADLVNEVLARVEREAELQLELHTRELQVIQAREAAHDAVLAEARAVRAKRRHWATIKRLRGDD